MTETLHPAVPTEIVENIDELLKDMRIDLGFKKFDKQTSPQIYQGISILYFFELGSNIHNTISKTVSEGFYYGLIKQLQTANLIEPKPKNYDELKATFQNLFSETSKYLTDRI